MARLNLKVRKTCLLARLTLLMLLVAPTTFAAKLHIAVAANFKPVLSGIVARFEQKSEHQLIISSGSSGTLFAQIINGAPFDIFLSADSERPIKLEQKQLIVEQSRLTYTIGQLAYLQPNHEDLDLNNLSELSGKVAIANPKTAPYGKAAIQVLNRLKGRNIDRSQLVLGNNVAQTYQFVQTRNAQAGLVAHSLLVDGESDYLVVPQSYYDAIKQQLVILKRTVYESQAKQFVEFLLSEEIQQTLAESGYQKVTQELKSMKDTAVARH